MFDREEYAIVRLARPQRASRATQSKSAWTSRLTALVIAVSKIWRSIDVPIDGVVKEESTLSSASGFELYRTTKVLTGCGSAGRARL
jgi:hypothetical protein